LTVADANQKLGSAGSGPLDVKLQASLESGDGLVIRYDGNDLTTIASEDLENGRGQVEVLIDKGIAEIFVDGGARYITREIPLSTGGHGLELSVKQKTSVIHHLEIYEMKSMWKPRTIS
jgi:fructan beta-fructosidase